MPGWQDIALPPGINEPDVLIVIAEVANYARYWSDITHPLQREGWQWLSSAGYCCTSPQASVNVISRLTTEYDTFLGDGTDTVSLYVDATTWIREWVGIWAVRDAGNPVAYGAQGFGAATFPLIDPPWSESQPCVLLSGIVVPDPHAAPAVPAGYTLDGSYFQVEIPNEPVDHGGFKTALAHMSRPDSPAMAHPVWGVSPVDTFYNPGFVIIVPPAGHGVCYSWPTWDAGKNDPGERWERRCWEQYGLFKGEDTWQLSSVAEGALRLFGYHDYNLEGDDPGSDVNSAEVFQSRYPFAPPGPYDTPHVARLRFTWNPVGTVRGDITSRSFGYRVGNVAHEGGALITFPTTADPTTKVITGPSDDQTIVTIPDLTPGVDYILEVDFFAGVKVRLDTPNNIDTAPYLAVVPYHQAYPFGFMPNTYPTLSVPGTCSANDTIDVKYIDLLSTPGFNQVFEIIVGYGDDQTITFQGWPTQTDSAKWYVNGDLVRPEQKDETTGSVTFTRPPGFDAAIVQQGRYAGA